jgi:hypothetical protein
MSRLTARPYKNSDFFSNKLILKHPSVTPDGYRFLFTQSDPKYTFNQDYKNENTVTNNRGEQVTVGQYPTYQTYAYEKYDIYEKLDEMHVPILRHARHVSRHTIDKEFILNGYTIPPGAHEIVKHFAHVLSDGLEVPVKTTLTDLVIKFEGLDKHIGYLIYVTYDYTYKGY